MGSDNLFHKRRARKVSTLKRSEAKMAPYDVVLIVCEGGKTEPQYFSELRDSLRLSNANIRICGEACGSSPRNVVDFAIEKYKKNKGYDRVYCVFDKDRHPTYQEAIDRIRGTRLSKGHSIHPITSVPCFEVWFLLHYKYSTKGYADIQGSICAQVIKDLKEFIPNYEKGLKKYVSGSGENSWYGHEQCQKALRP